MKQVLLIAPYVIFAINLLTNALAYPTMPDFVPARFDFSGNVTAVGPKWIVWIPTLGMLSALVVMALADRFPLQFYHPRSQNADYRERIIPVLREVNAMLRILLMILCILIDGLVYAALPTNQAPSLSIIAVLVTAFAVLLSLIGGFVRLRKVL